jgi:hypothetical protein
MDSFAEKRKREVEVMYPEHKNKIFEMVLQLLGDGMVHQKGEILGITPRDIPSDLVPDMILRALFELENKNLISERKGWYKIIAQK